MKIIGKLRAKIRSFKLKTISFCYKKPPRYSDFSIVVNRMTNWQRSQWAQRGYPGLFNKETAKVIPFTELKKVRK